MTVQFRVTSLSLYSCLSNCIRPFPGRIARPVLWLLFICLSAHLSESEASADGYSAFVRKPFDIQHLVETVVWIIKTA